MIIEFEEKLLEMIDARIETASDDELFAGGYLRGHISLSAASCEEEGVNDIEELKVRIQSSLDEARAELSPADRTIVNDLWLELVNQA
ncbi:YfcL family protein [Vibrio sp. Isolate25]|uniref:YfcL family protein n=1 Tax=Vibrio TaxID=662 RepID=UPI001EFD6495|nr:MULTISPECIES: YfcL family protein [Vibrio]MCG9598130.1 YfcL family protein [Vibrio sp. Isolate25]MCG9679551.1 YfcL family protein [Vibrio sp. Isolate24]MCG9683610.1 YfcL family protein [Vibrio sp. Isolate23]USD33277.1 YfcL family protein [Vibrio sp. SCSIO 43186]USD46347.1 YfcL family protein [Vibrio sp. SCSIO 43145]